MPKENTTNSNETKKLGKYKILKELGRGGMGVVYYAIDEELDRTVALKVLNVGADLNDEDRKRFEVEIKTSANLNNHNIVKLYEAGIEDGHRFYAMEYVDGPDLKHWTKANIKHSSYLTKALKIVRDIAVAVSYAHKEGIVHRDLKPQNILIDNNNVPKIVDFGLAKAIDSDSFMTVTGQVLGTPSYMSPEQARGDSKEVNKLSDVYSLGAILYETVTGTPPFTGDQVMQIIADVCSKDPIPPTRGGLPLAEDIKTIIYKAMEKEPSRRYQSSLEFADDIDRFLNGQVILAKKASFFYKSKKKIVQNKPLSVSILIIILGLIIFAGYILKLKYTENRQKELRRRAIEVVNSAKTIYSVDDYVDQVLKATEIDDTWEIPYIEVTSRIWYQSGLHAIEYLKEAMKINQNNPTIYYYFLLIYTYKDRNPEMFDYYYKEGLKHVKKNSLAYYKLQYVYLYANKKYKEAYVAVNKAIELSSESPELMKQKLQISINIANSKYIENCKILSEVDPGYKIGTYYGSYYMDLTEFYFQNNQYDKALEMINKALILNPENLWPYYYRGRINFNTTKYEEALKDIKYILDMKLKYKDESNLHYSLLGNIYYKLGDITNAKKYYKLSISTNDSTDNSDRTEYIKLLFNIKDYDEAIKLGKETIELFKSNSFYNNYVAVIANLVGLSYQGKGNLKKSTEYLKYAYELNKEDEINVFNYYGTLIDEQQYEKASEILDKLIETGSFSYQGIGKVFKILNSDKQYDEIVRIINNIVLLHPKHKDILSLIRDAGLYMIANKKYKDAINIFKKYISMDPSNPEIYVYIAQSYRYLGNSNLYYNYIAIISEMITTSDELNQFIGDLADIGMYNIELKILLNLKKRNTLGDLPFKYIISLLEKSQSKEIFMTYASGFVYSEQATENDLFLLISSALNMDYFEETKEFLAQYYKRYGRTLHYSQSSIVLANKARAFNDHYDDAINVLNNFQDINNYNIFQCAIFTLFYYQKYDQARYYLDLAFANNLVPQEFYFYISGLINKKKGDYKLALSEFIKARELSTEKTLKDNCNFLIDSLTEKIKEEKDATLEDK